MFVGKIFYIKNYNFAIPDLQKFGNCIDNIDNYVKFFRMKKADILRPLSP